MTSLAEKSMDNEFVASILRSLDYWQSQTQHLQPDQIKQLDKQRRNLNTAVQFGLIQPETWEATATVLLQAFNFAEWRGYWQEWIPTLEQALANAPEKETVLYGSLLNRLGQLYRLSHQFPEALERHNRALDLGKLLAEPELVAFSYYNLCILHLNQNQAGEAKRYGDRALKIAETLPDQDRLLAFVLIALGQVARFSGDLQMAEDYLRQATILWRSLFDPVYLARVLNDLGNTLRDQNKFQAAQAAFSEAFTILQPTTNVIDKAKIQLNLGFLFYRQERWIEAEKSFCRIDQIALQEQNDFVLLGLVNNNLGNTYLKQQRNEEAAQALEKAITIWRSLGNELELANSLGTLAEVQSELDQFEQAKTLYQEALRLLVAYPESAWGQKLVGQFEAALTKLES